MEKKKTRRREAQSSRKKNESRGSTGLRKEAGVAQSALKVTNSNHCPGISALRIPNRMSSDIFVTRSTRAERTLLKKTRVPGYEGRLTDGGFDGKTTKSPSKRKIEEKVKTRVKG